MTGEEGREGRPGDITGADTGKVGSLSMAGTDGPQIGGMTDADGRQSRTGDMTDTDGRQGRIDSMIDADAGQIRLGADGVRADRAARARRYFAQNGFSRMLAEVWRKYAALERVGGHAIVPEASAEECDAINAFFGWNHRPGDTLRIPLELFERELLASAFPFGLAELHRVMTGRSLLTKSELVLMAEQSWAAMFGRVASSLAEETGAEQPLVPQLAEWLDGLQRGNAAGYRTVRELMLQTPEEAETALTIAVRALIKLKAQEALSAAGRGEHSLPLPVRLPILAARVSGDAHALDRDKPAGRLFFQALRSAAGAVDESDDAREEGDPSSRLDSLRVRDLYRSAGVADDDVSSLVHVYFPGGEGGVREGVETLTLRKIEAVRWTLPVSDVYVVENPSVFSALADLTEQQGRVSGSAGKPKPLLLCTSGPASAASLRLLDMLAGEGMLAGSIRYSGDFDVRGLEMGNVLAGRYGSRYAGWRFGSEDYLQGIEANKRLMSLTETERGRLASGKPAAVWDERLAAAMAKAGVKLFQEQLMDALATDWLAAAGP